MTCDQAKNDPSTLIRFFPIKTLTLILLALMVFNSSAWSDPPEEGLWNEQPLPWRPDRMGPQTEPVDETRYAELFYISIKDGSDLNGKGTQASPWNSIHHGLEEVKRITGEKPVALLVAEGTYHEAPLNMLEKVDLYGGFEAGSWKRDIPNHPTILDGDKKDRVVVAANHARLDGFTLTGGKVRGDGAGILCLRTSPIIVNNTITGNLTLEPDGFVHDPDRRRHLGDGGGAIACVDASHPQILNNLIHGNRTQVGNGAGIDCRNDSCPKIAFNIIWGNETGLTDLAPTRTSNGGGVSCFAGADPFINNNLIANNAAEGRSDGGGIYCEYHSSPLIAYNYILGNFGGDDGGGLESMKGSYPKVNSNIFAGNTTSHGGGAGIRLSDQGLGHIVNNLIVSNASSGIVCSNSWMFFANNTVTQNFTARGAAVGLENERWPQLMPPILINNIIFDNDSPETIDLGVLPNKNHPKPVLSHNFIDGDPGLEDEWTVFIVVSTDTDSARFQTQLTLEKGTAVPSSLLGRAIKIGETWSVVISTGESALTVWGEIGSATQSRVMPSYHPRPGSPCIDAGKIDGAPSHDFAGEPRSGKMDIGSYSY